MIHHSATAPRDRQVVQFPLETPTDVSAAKVLLCDESGRPWTNWQPDQEAPVTLKPNDRLMLQVTEHEPGCTATILNAAPPGTFEGVSIGQGAASPDDIAAIGGHGSRDVCLGPWWKGNSDHQPTKALGLPPDLDTYAALRHLERLEVHHARFGNDQLHALGSGSRIRHLAFTQTEVTGAAVAAGLFSNLTNLRLEEDPGIPADLDFLDRLPNLEYLSLRATGLSDEQLTALRPCRSIERLDLSENPIGGTSLAALTALPGLNTLVLTNTDIGNDTVGSLEDVHSLHNLHLTHTDIGDGGVRSLGRLRSIWRLWLPYTRITDQGMSDLVHVMPRLYRLDVSMTDVTAAGLHHIRHLKNLFRLDASPEALNGELVEVFSGMSKMGEIGLRGPGDANAIWDLMATIADTLGGAQYMGQS